MKYPIGIQTFSEIINQGYVYVDKTEHVYNLAHGGKYYFLSRPRRFGKSLLVSTLDAYFSGKSELFKGLAIEKLEQDWETYPVLRLSFGGTAYTEKQNLYDKLDAFFTSYEQIYDVKNVYTTYGERFNTLINTVYQTTGKQVVILIDEYDKPIVDNIDNPQLMDYCRTQLQGKIGKLSVFSGLNNLKDISLVTRYNDICGISESELHEYFDDEIQAFSNRLKISKDECYTRLKAQYDGYRFSDEEAEGIYNPFSLLNALSDKSIKDYWFETATPLLLVKVIEQTSFDLSSISDLHTSATFLANSDSIFDNPVPLLFQTGYLTIKDYNTDGRFYNLQFPNNEVKSGFFNYLLPFYAPIKAGVDDTLVYKLRMSLVSGDADGFMKQLHSLFARTPYQIQSDCEKDFQYAMFIIVQLLGIDIQAEYQTSDGRIDLLIRTDKFIYIIEIKLDGTAVEALQQIEEKDYAAPFAADTRKIFKIGVNFDKQTRRLGDWKERV